MDYGIKSCWFPTLYPPYIVFSYFFVRWNLIFYTYCCNNTNNPIHITEMHYYYYYYWFITFAYWCSTNPSFCNTLPKWCEGIKTHTQLYTYYSLEHHLILSVRPSWSVTHIYHQQPPPLQIHPSNKPAPTKVCLITKKKSSCQCSLRFQLFFCLKIWSFSNLLTPTQQKRHRIRITDLRA